MPPPKPGLTAEQQERYARHLLLPDFGPAGQARLRQGRVLVVGVGGLGSPAAFYLAAAGVGTLGLMDADRVSLSNLQRQILHFTPDLGREKTQSAADKLRQLNPDVQCVVHNAFLTAANAPEVLPAYDLVLDATDNFTAKFFIAKSCHQFSKPYVHAGISNYCGQLMTVIPGQTTCYRCIFEEPPPADCPTVPQGPLGALPGVIGSLQALEAIKYLAGVGQLLTNALLTVDVLDMAFRKIAARRNPRCPICGAG